MPDSTSKDRGIDYPPSALCDFTVTGYEWNDNLRFTFDPGEFVQDVEDYLATARRRFTDAGWSCER
ncbi:hypothetical protein RHDE110596_05785 [Prescottella defluvii]|uniref:hypothetical protein n=1 Tax=Prescottella defluvii TaxID=1323361 RepID=UPI0004F28334